MQDQIIDFLHLSDQAGSNSHDNVSFFY